ncbi:MAG: hypothetical protein ACFFDN_49290 [Candidatus Hodarchaeota archaeon]
MKILVDNFLNHNVHVTITDHESAVKYVHSFPPIHDISLEEVIERIIKLNENIAGFWHDAKGLAPLNAANLLNKSRLDWQVSLSHCLKNVIEDTNEKNYDGRIIMGYANLGSLVEGTMKLFLSVWYNTYKDDVDAIRKKSKLQDPDGLELEPLRIFFLKKIWDADWDKWINHIQYRRNAIHAYKDREIGTHADLKEDIREYLKLLRYINFRLPYPDDIYVPREI